MSWELVISRSLDILSKENKKVVYNFFHRFGITDDNNVQSYLQGRVVNPLTTFIFLFETKNFKIVAFAIVTNMKESFLIDSIFTNDPLKNKGSIYANQIYIRFMNKIFEKYKSLMVLTINNEEIKNFFLLNCKPENIMIDGITEVLTVYHYSSLYRETIKFLAEFF